MKTESLDGATPLVVTSPLKQLARMLASYRLQLAMLDGSVFALFFFGVFSLWLPGYEWANFLRALLFGGICSLIGYAGFAYRRQRVADSGDKASDHKWRLLREMTVPAVRVEQADVVLLKSLGAELRMKLIRRRQQLLGPALFSLLILVIAQPDPMRGFSQFYGTLAIWKPAARVRVVKGDPHQNENVGDRELAVYRHRPVKLDLLEGNLIEVFVPGVQSGTPVIEMPELSQSFVMAQATDRPGYSLTLTVSKSSEIHLRESGGSIHLASVKVLVLPVPEVSLAAPAFQGNSTAGDPFDGAWLDDKPLPLSITVKGEASLAAVKLLIKSGKLEFTENVLNVMSEDKREIQTNYQVTLEPYIENDEAEVTLIAFATDRAVPLPLTGFSEPLTIPVLSAYGRYRRTLETLKNLKEMVDNRMQAGGKKKNSQSSRSQDVSENLASRSDMNDLMAKAIKQSVESPYFDAMDRNDLMAFRSALTDNDDLVLIDLSAGLGEFLFQHESIDQRERDRDFFVAMRTMSRVLQQPDKARQVSLGAMLPRLKSFLDERQLFWAKRVERLGRNAEPRGWPVVRDRRPFHRLIQQISNGMSEGDEGVRAKNARDLLGRIASSVGKYREWIEELESKEDEQRRRREAEQQQRVASITSELRELQRRQNEISSGLDQAVNRSAEDLDARWPGLRASQNSNLKGTRSLEGKIRSFAPGAEGRFRAAVEMMEKTVESGNGGQFPVAESSSDRAGRLLRQTEQAARRAASSSQSRGRRRRVNGDSYYGQSIVGGDVEIKREYQVDRKYREDILDEVARSRVDEADKILLDRYTREIVR